MLLIGDLHNDLYIIKELADAESTETNFIQVGDFGLGFYGLQRDLAQLDDINERLVEKNKHLYVIRGNHDDPSFFDGIYDDAWSNLHLMQDYSVECIEGKMVLFVGGAISIDRVIRVRGRDYWVGESFNYDEKKIQEIIKKYGTIDMVVAHIAPDFCPPTKYTPIVYDYLRIDSELNTDLLVERTNMTSLYYDLEPILSKDSIWCYGHYHFNSDIKIKDTRFILLGIHSKIKI